MAIPLSHQFAGMSEAMWANDAENPNRIQAQPRATHWEGERMPEQDTTYGVKLSDGWGPWLTDEEKKHG